MGFYDAFDAQDDAAAAAAPPPPPGGYDPGAYDKYTAAAVADEVNRVQHAANGTRNDSLNTAAFSLYRLTANGVLPREVVEHELYTAAQAVGLPHGEIMRTLASAYRGRLNKPRHLPQLREAQEPPEVTKLNMEPTSDHRHDPPPEDDPARGRRLILRSAATIQPRPVRWLWEGRLALGSLALLAGREGIGKSTIAYQRAADVTRGTLPGELLGKPRAVIVAATEDALDYTIVPRLIAAGADLDKVFFVEVMTSADIDTDLILPRDLARLAEKVSEVDAALVLLDPLMSRLDAKLDTHKDADVRRALEPVVALAENTGACVLGLIHVNKSTGTDPLNNLMGSRAFSAVARAVLFAARDDEAEDDGACVLAQAKNNLGRMDLPTISYRIVSHHVCDTDEGPVYTGRVEWGEETSRRLVDVLEAAVSDPGARSATQEAAEWLDDWLTSKGGTDESANAKKAGKANGHSESALKRAAKRLKVETVSEGFPRKTFWTLPGTAAQSGQPQSDQSGQESCPF